MALSRSNAEPEAPLEPQGNGSANDAQKKLVEESKNAGVAAFTFDPDASPEEKKRQAAAVSSCLNPPNEAAARSSDSLVIRSRQFPRV